MADNNVPNAEVVDFIDQVVDLLTAEELKSFEVNQGGNTVSFKEQMLNKYGDHYLHGRIADKKKFIAEELYIWKDSLKEVDQDWGDQFVQEIGMLFSRVPTESHVIKAIRVALVDLPWYLRAIVNLLLKLLVRCDILRFWSKKK